VQLATLKQRAEKAARTAGRMPAGSQAHRLVPLSDKQYVSQLEMMVATLKIPSSAGINVLAEQRKHASGKLRTAPSEPG
jgi:hypothetical protein